MVKRVGVSAKSRGVSKGRRIRFLSFLLTRAQKFLSLIGK